MLYWIVYWIILPITQTYMLSQALKGSQSGRFFKTTAQHRPELENHNNPGHRQAACHKLVSAMDPQAKLDKGIELKNAGNKLFASNDLKGGTS
jgi:hypothetical protein